jgi:hypothetical protein
MIVTDEQRRWWFATHPEYSGSHKQGRNRSRRQDKEEDDKVRPEDVDAYVDNALGYVDGPVADLLKSVKRNFGTQADADEHDEFGANHGAERESQQPTEPVTTIGPPRPPGLSDRARYVLDIFLPGLTTAYDRWLTGYYKAYPWAPGPAYDALPGLVVLVTSGLAGIQAALAKAVNRAEIAALQNARQELLKLWDLPYFPRGEAIEILLGRNLPKTFKCIDRWADGVATSIKTMDLGLKSYQDPAQILKTGRGYVRRVANFPGATMRKIRIRAQDITERVLRLGVPPGATGAQKSALKGVIEYGKQNGVKVEVIRVP